MSDNVTSVREFIHENASNNDSTGLNASDNVTSVTDNHKRLFSFFFFAAKTRQLKGIYSIIVIIKQGPASGTSWPGTLIMHTMAGHSTWDCKIKMNDNH